MKQLTIASMVPLFLLAGRGEAQSDQSGRMAQVYREHMELLGRYAPRPGRPAVVRRRPTTPRPPERARPRAARPRPARRVHHASANACGPRMPRGPMPSYDGLVGDQQRYWTAAMSRELSTVRPRVLNEMLRIANTLAPTDTTRLGAEALPGSPRSVTLGELRAFTRATGREAGIWWDPVQRKNTIGLGNSQPVSVNGVMAYITPVPSRSSFLIAHTHPAGRSSSPSDGDFAALQGHQQAAVAALKGWPRDPGPHSFRRFKSLLVPMDGRPVIFTVDRPDR